MFIYTYDNDLDGYRYNLTREEAIKMIVECVQDKHAEYLNYTPCREREEEEAEIIMKDAEMHDYYRYRIGVLRWIVIKRI